jgi:putative transposase
MAVVAPPTAPSGQTLRTQANIQPFWGSLQIELLNRQKWRTNLELAIAIAEFIEFHNSARRHSSLGYLTPNEFEELHSKTIQQAALS